MTAKASPVVWRRWMITCASRAGRNQRDGIAATHVLIDDAEPTRSLGYCALSVVQLHLQELCEDDRKQLLSFLVPTFAWGDWPSQALSRAGL